MYLYHGKYFYTMAELMAAIRYDLHQADMLSPGSDTLKRRVSSA